MTHYKYINQCTRKTLLPMFWYVRLISLLLVILYVSLVSPLVHADFTSDLNSIYNGTTFYDSISNECTTQAADELAPGTGYYAVIWDYFVNKKSQSPLAAAAFLGNFEVEAPTIMKTGDQPEMPFDTDPKTGAVTPAKSIYGKQGYGIAQWTVPSRQLNFLLTSFGGLSAPFEKPRSTKDISYQLDYVWYEVNSKYFPTVKSVISDPNATLQQMSDEIAERFEAPRSMSKPDTKAISLKARFDASQRILSTYGNGSVVTTNTNTGCASTPATGDASKYIKDCAANSGNAAIACTAINQLLGIPYSRNKRAPPTDRAPAFLDCSSFVAMAIYRTFNVDLGSICSIDFLSNKNFEVIKDIRTIQTGDMVGIGTVCGEEGHIALVVSYDPDTHKLITAESHGLEGTPSGILGINGNDNVYLKVDKNDRFSYEWAVRYVGDNNLQSGAL